MTSTCEQPGDITPRRKVSVPIVPMLTPTHVCTPQSVRTAYPPPFANMQPNKPTSTRSDNKAGTNKPNGNLFDFLDCNVILIFF